MRKPAWAVPRVASSAQTVVSPCIVKKWRNKLWQKKEKLC